MALVRWDAKYLVGQPQIDDEHRYLFQLINDFYDTFVVAQNRALVLSLLNRLVDYAQRHFSNEERLMQAAGYPALDKHREHHVRLFEEIFALHERFQDRALNPTHDTAQFLRGWLADHIVHEDLEFGSHLRNLQQGAAQEASGVQVGRDGG